MIFGPIRAVAIDDEPSHLLGLTTGLTAIGIPCMGFWYDRTLNKLKPAPPESGLPFVRLVFMDLNLAEQVGVPDAAKLSAGVIDVLNQIIAKDGGPYLLVFWTRVGTRVDEVSTMVFDRLERVGGAPCPIAITSLDKAPFLIGEPTGGDFKAALQDFYTELHNNIDALKEGVRDAASYDPRLSALSFWESRASEAAGRAINQVYECAKGQAEHPTGRSDSTANVLAKIAVAAAGKKPAVASPARALDGGMLGILADQFGASVEAAEYTQRIRDAIGDAVKNDPAEFRDPMQLFAGLNTLFHVDNDIAAAVATDRGVVLSAGQPFNKGTLGFNSTELITSEFLFPFETFPREQQATAKALLNDVGRAAQVVLVEVGADCDHAQATKRTRRYLIGLEVPQRFMKLATHYESGKPRSDALQVLGPWRFDEEIRYLLVSCRRFWIWQRPTPPAATIRYRLRSALVNKLLSQYSAWSNRPGIVEFR